MADRSVSVKLKADIAGYVASMRTASQTTAAFAENAAKAQRDVSKETLKAEAAQKRAAAEGQARALKSRAASEALGKGLIVAGLGIGAAVGAAVKSFADFDKQMSVVKAVSNEGADGMTRLRKAAMDAGRDTKFSATEAAQAEAELAKVGLSAADILGGALKGSLNLAAAGNVSLADAATYSGQAMKIFNLAGKDVPRIADALAAGANKSAADVTDLAQALQQGGLVAAQTGLTMEDTVGTLSAFADNALMGSDAGTSFKTMLQALNPRSDEAAALMDELGIRAYDASGNFVGITKYAGILQDKLSGLSVEQRNAALSTIFGSDAVRAANILYTQGSSGIATYIKGVKDQSAASRVAATQMDNLAGDLEQLKGSLETALIQSGGGANSALRDLAKGATAAVNAFSKLPAPIQEGAVKIGALVAGVALVGGAALVAVPKIVAFRESMATLAGSSDKASGAIRGTVGVLGKLGIAATVLSVLPTVLDSVDRSVGNVGSNVSDMALELSRFGQGANLAGDAAKTFGGNLDGIADRSMSNLFTKTESLKKAINDLSGTNGFFRKDLPFLGSPEAKQISQYSKALAELAGRDAPAAEAAFSRLSKEAGLNKAEQERLLKLMPEYKSALNAAALAADTAAISSGHLSAQAQALRDAEASVQKQSDMLAEAQSGLVDAMGAASNATLSARDAQRGYYASLDATKEALKSNGKTLDVHTAKGRANQEALDAQSSASLKYLQTIYEQQGPGAAFSKTLTETRNNLIKAAEKFGMGKVAAGKYADQILAVPKQAATQVTTPGLETARQNLRYLQGDISGLKGKGVSIRIDATGTVTQFLNGKRFGRQMKADGGVIRAANGGPREDNVPILASRGEYVVNAHATANNFGLLEAINSGTVPKRAAGGPVDIDVKSRLPARGSMSAFETSAATAMASDYAAKFKKATAGMVGTGDLSGVPSSVSGNAAILRAVAAGRGWGGGNQWAALYKLIQGESGFRNTAQNPSSTAYGMFQFLNSTWAGVGGRKTSDPHWQSEYGLRYIAQSYGTPANAYSKWSSRHPHWYDSGGVWESGTVGVNQSGKPEVVFTDSQWKVLRQYADPSFIARSGMSRGSAAPQQVSNAVNLNGPIYAQNPDELAARIERKQRQALALHSL